MGRRDLLDDAAIDAALVDLGWRRDGAALVRDVRLPTFRDAIAFVGRVADIAEELDHHPDIDIRWRKVHLSVSTHDRGGITGMDLELARRVDALLATSAADAPNP
jgi:4a-hydroxytetrahydrobiopterin dehydratase